MKVLPDLNLPSIYGKSIPCLSSSSLPEPAIKSNFILSPFPWKHAWTHNSISSPDGLTLSFVRRDCWTGLQGGKSVASGSCVLQGQGLLERGWAMAEVLLQQQVASSSWLWVTDCGMTPGRHRSMSGFPCPLKGRFPASSIDLCGPTVTSLSQLTKKF